jgi:hypothetical protein
MEKRLNVLAAVEHVVNENHVVVVLNRIQDDVVAAAKLRRSADKSGRRRPMRGCVASSQNRSLMFCVIRAAVSTLPLSRAMYNHMSSSRASAWKERR